jgi:nucleoside-diphosphate-sugar epimerase
MRKPSTYLPKVERVFCMMNNNERILVTGANGFIGKALIADMKTNGYDVVGFDIEDGDIAKASLNFKGISHVFHLAAMTFVPKSWDNPQEFYRVNVMGTVNVLEFCRRSGSSITMPSTYMYGTPQYLPTDEKHPEEFKVSPYHNSKKMAEEICHFYATKMNVPAVILRLFNVYGFGQGENFLVPSIIGQALSDAPVIEVMDLAPRRDYIFVEDIIAAMLLTMEKRAGGFELYNLGYGASYSVEEVIKIVLQIFAVKKSYTARGVRRPGEIMDTVADTSKIRNALGWIPHYDLFHGIAAIKKRMGG